MIIKINCKYNDRGAWCTNKQIKRSLFGMGVRCCIEEPYGPGCSIKEPYPVLPSSPPPMKKMIGH